MYCYSNTSVWTPYTHRYSTYMYGKVSPASPASSNGRNNKKFDRIIPQPMLAQSDSGNLIQCNNNKLKPADEVNIQMKQLHCSSPSFMAEKIIPVMSARESGAAFFAIDCLSIITGVNVGECGRRKHQCMTHSRVRGGKFIDRPSYKYRSPKNLFLQ